MAKVLELDADYTGGIPTAGVHNAHVESAEVKMNKAQDGKNLVMKFVIDDGGSKGKSVMMWQSLKPEQSSRYTVILQALGVIQRGEKLLLDVDKIAGAKCKILVSHEKFNGEDAARINQVIPVSAVKRVEESEFEEEETETETPSNVAPTKLGKKPAAAVAETEVDEEGEPVPKAAAKTKKKAVASAEEESEEDDGLPY